MNCEIVNNHIEKITLHNVDVGINNDVICHVKICPTCEKSLKQQLSYLNRIADLHTPELSEHTASILLNKVVNKSTTKPAKNDSSFVQGFIAASVLAVSIFGAWNLYNTSPELTPINVVVNDSDDYYITEVVLVIDAPEDMYDADLNITLPQQIALEGYDNIQELNWPVDLKAGTNTLSLPIRVNKHQANEQPLSIMAKLYHYAEEREFEIKVDVNKIQGLQKKSANLAPNLIQQIALNSTKDNALTPNTLHA